MPMQRIIDILKVLVSNAYPAVHVFWNVNQDGGQWQTTYRKMFLY
jgi:hypothetical protein